MFWKIIKLLDHSDGITVIDDPETEQYPTPIEHANDTEDVFVGRIRSQKLKDETWISMWIVADNLRKGAATNTIQIAEYLVKNKLV